MGYRTNFNLTMHGEDKAIDAVLAYAQTHDLPYELKTIVVQESLDDVKWYDCKEDLRSLAKRFPTVLFILTGVGEDPGDQWEYRVRGEKDELRQMDTIAPPFGDDLLMPGERFTACESLDVGDRLRICAAMLRNIARSGYIPFASPCPCSNETAIKDCIRTAIDKLEEAVMRDKAQFGRNA